MRSDPAVKAFAVTPSDAAINNFRALYIGGAGNVTVKCGKNDTAVTFYSVPAGTILPVSVELVMATGTSATNIVGLL